jgi:hypothetical protein
LKSKADTHISHSSGKVFNKPAFPQGFLACCSFRVSEKRRRSRPLSAHANFKDDPSGSDSTVRSSKLILGWSGREDSNLRPLGPKPSALPGCATPRKLLRISKKRPCRRGCILRVGVNWVKRPLFSQQKFLHLRNCLCPMAYLVFNCFGQLSKRLTVTVREENRIITKA